MRLSQLIPNKKLPLAQELRSTTLRGFGGGWNVLDDDMNLSFKYSTRAENVYMDNDGVARVRQGTTLFANCLAYFSTAASIVEMWYYNEALVVVGSNGEILKVLGDGTISRIWDAAIAAALLGAPSAWSATEFASAADFNGHLIICNGIDKPLDIDKNFIVEYLQDAATGTNINIPICKYVVSFERYLCMAGDPLRPDRIHISAKDAAGTWFGDPPPNDATRIDVGSVLPGASTIRGLSVFRGNLVVMFAEGLIFGQLGTYNASGSHTPSFDDGISGYGSIAHRSAIPFGDDGLFLDLEGVPSIKRTALSTSFKPERPSGLIDPEIKATIAALSFAALEDRVFAVHNRADGQYMVFIPNAELLANTTETLAYVYNYRPMLGQDNWSRFRGWNFTCGARSLSGRVFFGDKNAKIWLYGTETDEVNSDYIDLVSPASDPVGVPITFDWELPWLDFGNRAVTKRSKYLELDTRGASEFAVHMYVDNFIDSDTLYMEFSGGEQGLFGGGPQPFGGGRNTAIKKHFGWPSKFKIAKLRFTGSADAQLAFVSITMHYQTGGINR